MSYDQFVLQGLQRLATDQLIRSYRFHDGDRGTVTTEEECRRMWLVQEIGAELRRRGVD
jgi:hypothetical protein